MSSANSRDPVPVEASRSSLSSTGQATFDLALRMGGLILAIVLVALLMFVLKPKSFNIDVGISVLRAMSSVAIMSLGLTLVIVVGEIDLSFGAMYGLGANSLAVMWILLGIPIYAALPLAVGVGALVGLFNGALVTWLRIPSFIVTLGTYNLLYGVSLWITKTSTFNPVYPPPGAEIPPAELDFFTGLTASFGAHPISFEVIWMLGLALVVGFLLHRTLFGFRLMAIGGNPVAAQLARLPVTRYKILAFVICSMLAAIAGILDFSFIQTSPAEHRPFLHVPGFRRRDHRRRQSLGRQGDGDRRHERSVAARRVAAGPRPAFAGAARAAALPRLCHDRRRRARPRAHQHPQAQGGMNGGFDGIRLRGLQKRYGATVALAGLDLDIRPGEVLGIAGPNGAGKSTLVRILAGEERPDSGELVFNGSPWTPSLDWRRVAVVHQEPQLFPNLTVAENVLVGREGTGSGWPKLGPADARVMKAFGIDRFADTPLADCTLATQQRAEIARAVAREAQVFLFDEPNSALTDEESDELFRELHKLAAEGRIVLLVTHRLGDLFEHAEPRRGDPRRSRPRDPRRRCADGGRDCPAAGRQPRR